MARPSSEVINLTDSNIAPPTQDEYQQYAARMVQILDRGHTIDRFNIKDAPAGVHYEWHRANDPIIHARLTAKGFVADDKLAASSEFIHTDGAGNPRIGDVRCYSIAKWKHELLEKIEAEASNRNLDPRKQKTDFLSNLESAGGFSLSAMEVEDSKLVGDALKTTLLED
jgi:hypothetical protein